MFNILNYMRVIGLIVKDFKMSVYQITWVSIYIGGRFGKGPFRLRAVLVIGHFDCRARRQGVLQPSVSPSPYPPLSRFNAFSPEFEIRKAAAKKIADANTPAEATPSPKEDGGGKGDKKGGKDDKKAAKDAAKKAKDDEKAAKKAEKDAAQAKKKAEKEAAAAKKKEEKEAKKAAKKKK